MRITIDIPDKTLFQKERGKTMTDRITQCDVVESCECCPRYGYDCDGKGDD